MNIYAKTYINFVPITRNRIFVHDLRYLITWFGMNRHLLTCFARKDQSVKFTDKLRHNETGGGPKVV